MLFTYALATLILWLVSGCLALVSGLVLCIGSVGLRRPSRLLADAFITCSRGLPTSLLVISAGVLAGGVPPQPWLPGIFPGTTMELQTLAWALAVALAAGSSGHLAVIFRASYVALGRYRIEQAKVLGMPIIGRVRLLASEASLTALPPTTARLVHHLHNTAFAALFPVADLFGWIQDRANATFDVTSYALIGAGVYAALSGAIWLGGRTLESWLGRREQPRSHLAHAEV